MRVQRAGDNRPTLDRALPPPDLAKLVEKQLVGCGSMAPASLLRVSDLIKAFANFLAARGVTAPEEIEPAHAAAFVRSLTRSGTEPSLATMHLRRSALRIFFREVKAIGVLDIDPSSDILLPPRVYRDLRPLTDGETERCRSFAAGMVGEPRYAIAWALAEATARVAELGSVRASDYDAEQRCVLLPGCSSSDPRRVRLTDWGLEQLDRFLSAKPRPADDHLLVGSRSRGSIHELIVSTLRRASVANGPGVHPNSIAAWRGAEELAGGSSIDEVARLLGMRSLDRAASFVGFDWKAGA